MARVHAIILLSLLVGTGCHTTPKQPPVTVVVRDAETKLPIDGATVDLSTARGLSVAKKVTAGGGLARLADLPKDEDDYLDVSATGYLTAARPLYTSPDPATAGGPPPAVEVALYAAPQPAVELVVPASFRGLITAELQITAPADPARPRMFRATVAADGKAQIVGPAVLHALTPQDFRAVRPDGTAIPTGGPPEAVELRWVKTTDAIDYFVFGTRSECDDARKTLDPQDKSRGGDSGGKGGGKQGGGGGRHGGGGRGMGGMGR